jgi:putative spermidine/putrescine transport system permease protein
MTRRVGPLALLVLLLPGVGYLMMFFGIPLVRVIYGSFLSQNGAGFSLDTWASLFSNPVYMDGLRYSVWLAVAPTVASLVIAIPLSALMQANETSRNVFGTLYKIPLVVPGIVAGFLVLIILDRGGMLSRLLQPLGIPMPRLVRDDLGVGAIIASSWKNIPFMTLIIAGAMAAINKDVLHAARTLGAGRLTVLLRIQLPLAQPGITAAVLLTFIGSVGSYVIPSLLGPSYPKPLSILMFEQGFQAGNWPLVYAMGTLLSIVAIVVLLAYYAIIGSLGRQKPVGT